MSTNQEARAWSNDREDCFASSIKHTWLSRLGKKLFPPHYCDLPSAPENKHGQFKDVLMNTVTVDLDWKDRIRALVSGRIRTDTRVITENIIGDIMTKATFYTLPPKFMEPKDKS